MLTVHCVNISDTFHKMRFNLIIPPNYDQMRKIPAGSGNIPLFHSGILHKALFSKFAYHLKAVFIWRVLSIR